MAANKKATNVIAAVVTFVSVIALYTTLHGFGPRVDTTAHKALGQMVAEEALKARGPAGRITVLARDTGTQKNPYADAELETLQHTLKKARGVITTTRLLKLNPIRLIAVAPGDFFDVLKKASEEDVVVSLIGPPVLSDQQAAKLGERHPKIVAICAGWTPQQVNLRRIFEQGLLSAAIISRPDPSASGGRSMEETFSRNFAVITSANLSELPLMASAV